MRVAIADRDADALAATAEELRVAHGGANVLAVALDVAKFDEVKAFADRVFEWEGEVALVLNNAGIAPKGTSWSGLDAWRAIVDVNLLGVVNVQQAFVPHMMPNENPGLFINTGSKQGITNPPGNAAYNASKAAVKSLTESLAHELRAAQSKLTAHLFVPGWTFTGLGGATKARASKPPGAWTPAQTVKYMLERVRLGEFYIICPDDETSSTLDRCVHPPCPFLALMAHCAGCASDGLQRMSSTAAPRSRDGTRSTPRSSRSTSARASSPKPSSARGTATARTRYRPISVCVHDGQLRCHDALYDALDALVTPVCILRMK